MSRIIAYRGHIPHSINLHPLKVFKKPKKVYEFIGRDRLVGYQLVSHKHNKELRTSLIGVSFLNSEHDTTLETVDCEYPIVPVLDHLMSIYGTHDTPSRTKQRDPVPRHNLPRANGSYRDGRRKVPPPVFMIFHDLEAALGRLFRNNSSFRRAVLAGQKSVLVPIGDYELEIAQLIPGGSGCSFEIYARKDNKIIRLFGRNIKGYLSESPEANAKSFLNRNDSIVIPKEWSKRQWSSFEAHEIELLKQHVTVGASTARELYESLYKFLYPMSPHVVCRNKSLPLSVAGAAIKIAFSMSEVEAWERPPDRVMQMGALSYAGGRQFIHAEKGRYEDLYLYDAKSFHGFLMTLPPSPDTCKYIDIAPGPFHIEQWRGQFGAMCISGVVHDILNPPIREHDFTTRRLRYIKEPFMRMWATIPEVVLGVVSGRLSVTHIHDGIHMVSTSSHSFLREFALKMNAIKESAEEDSPRYILAKLLVNAIPGKLAEITTKHPYIDSTARRVMVPVDSAKYHKELYDEYIKGNEQLHTLADSLFAQSKHPDTETAYGSLLDRTLPYNATTGAHYLSMHAAQITGMSSGLLGLAATTTGAISGYTDSLITIGDASEGLARYRSIVQEAGYEAPEQGMGSFQTKIEHGHGWIVKSGLWVIRHIDRETGEVKQKAALHGLPDLGDKDAWDVVSHAAGNKHITYDSASRPAHLLESYRLHEEPGTQISQTKTLHTNPEITMPTPQEVDRSRKLTQDAMGYLARTSNHDIPTQQTARGCIKILLNFDLSYKDIAETIGVSYNVIKEIAAGRSVGTKHLEKLQQTVAQAEHAVLAS